MSKQDSESLANFKKDMLDQSFRDSVATISKEGNRNYIHPQKPKGKLYNLRSYFFTKCTRSKIHTFWKNILATGFFHFCYRITYIFGICYIIYCCFWQTMVWLGMPSNHFYGNGF